jgi:hypothetical protein
MPWRESPLASLCMKPLAWLPATRRPSRAS